MAAITEKKNIGVKRQFLQITQKPLPLAKFWLEIMQFSIMRWTYAEIFKTIHQLM